LAPSFIVCRVGFRSLFRCPVHCWPLVKLVPVSTTGTHGNPLRGCDRVSFISDDDSATSCPHTVLIVDLRLFLKLPPFSIENDCGCGCLLAYCCFEFLDMGLVDPCCYWRNFSNPWVCSNPGCLLHIGGLILFSKKWLLSLLPLWKQVVGLSLRYACDFLLIIFLQSDFGSALGSLGCAWCVFSSLAFGLIY
jgi:hypothetical protein